MISQKMQNAFNDQLNAEAYSSYLYMAMAAWCEADNLRGAARWLNVQGREEWAHAMKFYAHLVERGGRVQLKAIEAPPADWASLEALFEAVLGHERKVTARIHKLLALAQQEKDPAAGVFLQWFVTEQVEEEANATQVLHDVKMLAGNPAGLVMLDHQLGARKAD